VTSKQQDEWAGGSRQWVPSRPISRLIVIVICAMFILVFVIVSLDDTDNTSTDGPLVRKAALAYGFKFQLFAPSSKTSWTDVTFQLSAGSNTISWINLSAENLNSKESNTTWHYGHPQNLGSLSVWFNVTDLTGNGRLDYGDIITFTTGSDALFSSSTTYTLSILYEPTDESILALDFTG
jgi:hypothetical protein